MKVVFSRKGLKQIRKVPRAVQTKLAYWSQLVEKYGIREVRKIPGYHDEQLKGNRKGQRSIRLSRSWRAIYRIADNIVIIEVNHHDY